MTTTLAILLSGRRADHGYRGHLIMREMGSR